MAQIYGLETIFYAREDVRVYDGNPVAAQIHIVKLKIATYFKLYSANLNSLIFTFARCIHKNPFFFSKWVKFTVSWKLLMWEIIPLISLKIVDTKISEEFQGRLCLFALIHENGVTEAVFPNLTWLERIF